MSVTVLGELPNYTGRTVNWTSKANLGESTTVVISPRGEIANLNVSIQNSDTRANERWKLKIQPVLDTLLKGVENGQILIYLLDNTHGWPTKVHEESLWNPFKVYPLSAVVDFEMTSGGQGRILNYGGATYQSLSNSRFNYTIAFSGIGITPLFVVKALHEGTDKVIGGYFRHGKGLVLLAPINRCGEGQVTGYLQILNEVANEILSAKKESAGIPEWGKIYCLSPEFEVRQEIVIHEKKIDHHKSAINQLEQKINKFQDVKGLLWGTGEGFVDAAKIALTSLGYRVEKGPTGHVDLIAWDGNKLWAIEAKGLEGGVKDKNTLQLGKWKSELRSGLLSDVEERKVDSVLAQYHAVLVKLSVPLNDESILEKCESMLIVNPYYSTSPSERGPSYLMNVAPNLTRRNDFAITGIQLLGLYCAVEFENANKGSIRDALGNKPGIFVGYEDYNKFLKKFETTIRANDSIKSDAAA